MEKLILTSRPKRNYQFVQFLLDFFALFMLYLIVMGIIHDINAVFEYNRDVLRANDSLHGNPYPLITWGVIAVMIYAAGIILPFVIRNKTKLNQKQYDMLIYAVLLVRILGFVLIIFMMAIHLDLIMRKPNSLLNAQTLFEVIGCAVLIAVLVRFTQIRIKAAEPKEEEEEIKPREIVED
jgi:hypothetical protein